MFKKEEWIHCCLGKIWNLVAMQQRRVIMFTIFKLEKEQKGALQDMEGRSMKQF